MWWYSDWALGIGFDFWGDFWRGCMSSPRKDGRSYEEKER